MIFTNFCIIFNKKYKLYAKIIFYDIIFLIRKVIYLHFFYELIYIIICYLIGSIPTGLVVGKIFRNTDIRNYGSGNLGTTNAARVLGITLGIVVGLLDVMKGGLSIILAKNVFETNIPVVFFGIAAVIGHVFPIFARFKGGKAVATSGGVILFTSIPIFLIGITTFTIVVITTRVVSIGSTAVAFMILFSSLIAYFFRDIPFFTRFNVDLPYLLTMCVLFLFVLFRHIPNYKRLILGRENKVGNNNKHGNM